jgi:hypothetical protein
LVRSREKGEGRGKSQSMGTGVDFGVPELVSMHMDGMVGLTFGLGKVLAGSVCRGKPM